MAKTTKDGIGFKDNARRVTRMVGVSKPVLGRRTRQVLYADLGDMPDMSGRAWNDDAAPTEPEVDDFDPCGDVPCNECPNNCPHGGVL